AFRTPLGDMPVDRGACALLAAGGGPFSVRDDVHEGEHAIEVQVPFLQTVLPGAALVPLLVGELAAGDADRIGGRLAGAFPDARTLWLVSTDFTHYGAGFGYVPFRSRIQERLEELDLGAVREVLHGTAESLHRYIAETGATVCGAAALEILLAIRRRMAAPWTGRLLAYTTSGRLEHDDSHSVSYAAIAFTEAEEEGAHGGPPAIGGEAGRTLLRLAREAVRGDLLGPAFRAPPAESLPECVRQPLASFVTLTRHGELRGCMGSLSAELPLFQDVIENARNAAFTDPRFAPLGAGELAEVRFEVSVLGPRRAIEDPAEFEIGSHGIVLTKGTHGALYLPRVAIEQGWSRETTLDRLSRKAGLEAGAWRRGARLEVFRARVFAEEAAAETEGGQAGEEGGRAG
ncbi:MAG: AmmeMemoRadiSam system protein A, partial [Lentisphaeria bacterium]|nr:AmmeMemoRadiSam system protein A [Lentisphaeria bacterium]